MKFEKNVEVDDVGGGFNGVSVELWEIDGVVGFGEMTEE